MSRCLGERVWQEVVQSHHSQEGASSGAPCGSHTPDAAAGLTPAELAGHWDFSDPASKMICTCAKCSGGGTLTGGFLCLPLESLN